MRTGTQLMAAVLFTGGVRHVLLLFGFLVGEPVLPILQMKVGRDDSTTTLIPWLLS